MKTVKLNQYDAGIDVVRFLAFLLVFLHHFVYQGGNAISNASNAYWHNYYVDLIAFFGSEGVTIFFCLSGYLLSKLLIRELVETQKLSIRSFYIRRVLRIWPLYFSFLILCAITSGFLGNQSILGTEFPSLVTFTYNWHQIVISQSRGIAAILWSISVEEQIYLILPLLLVFFYKIDILRLPLLLISLGIFSRVLFHIYNLQLYRNTFSYMSTVGIGMLYALYEEKIRCWFQRNRILLSFVFSLLIIVYILYFKSFFSKGSLHVVAFDLTAMVAIFLLIMFGSFHSKLSNTLMGPLAFLGRRTYGMYIFHWPVLAIMVSRKVFFDDLRGISFIGSIFAFTLVVAISAFSYRFFEKPFLDLRKKYQYIKVG